MQAEQERNKGMDKISANLAKEKLIRGNKLYVESGVVEFL